MKMLPTLKNMPGWFTRADLLMLIEPQVPYDTALPQDWVNEVTSKGFDPRGQVVWAYPQGTVWGLPMPLTVEARTALIILNERLWEDE